MNTAKRKRVIVLAVLLVVSIVVCVVSSTPVAAAGAAYYVDCSAGSNGSGTQASPWNNLAAVNGTTFSAGDAILFKRGTTCTGQLWPKGSGASGSPITVGAYGSGVRPVIDGNLAVDPVVKLFDQQYWEIASLEVKNAEPNAGKGVYVGGSAGADLTYFRLTNLYVHHSGIHNGGNNVTTGMYQNHSVHDVVIDNVVTHNGFRGVENGGKCCNVPAQRSTGVIIRNVIAYDVENDGILAASANDVLVEYNVAYNTGIQPAQENHTPNGIWNWDTDNAVFQFNESYLSHSPEWDGGGFDIDYFSHNTTYQYNYGHDNDGYCISIFGGDGKDVTTNNVIRYNICSNDARDASYEEKRQGGIYLTIWSRGSVRDSYIYNNTVYWNPAGAYYAFKLFNIWHGATIVNTNVHNNIFYSASPKLVNVADFASTTYMDYNLYWYTGAGSPEFTWNGTTYTGFGAFQAGSGREAHGLYADPKLNSPTYHGVGMPTTQFTLQTGSPAINAGVDLVALGLQSSMGARDFFGNAIPNGAYDIGAHEYGGAPLPTSTPGGPTNTPAPPTNTPAPTNTPQPTSTLAPGGRIFYDNFEDGDMSDWSRSASNAQIRTESYEGIYCAGAKLGGWFSRGVSTAGRSNIHLKYAGMTRELDPGESLKVEWYDGSTWTVIDQLLSNEVYILRDWTLPAAAANNPNFAIRFTCVADKNVEWGFADIVEVTGQ